MPRMTSPSGDVLDIPTEGVHALRALGWEAEEPHEEPKPTRTRKPKE